MDEKFIYIIEYHWSEPGNSMPSPSTHGKANVYYTLDEQDAKDTLALYDRLGAIYESTHRYDGRYYSPYKIRSQPLRDTSEQQRLKILVDKEAKRLEMNAKTAAWREKAEAHNAAIKSIFTAARARRSERSAERLALHDKEPDRGSEAWWRIRQEIVDSNSRLLDLINETEKIVESWRNKFAVVEWMPDRERVMLQTATDFVTAFNVANAAVSVRQGTQAAPYDVRKSTEIRMVMIDMDGREIPVYDLIWRPE